MDVPPRLTGGELNAAVTRAVIRVHTSSLGRGPKKAVSFHSGNVLVTLLEDAMTNAERTLAGNGDGDAVLAMRALFQRSMADELKADVGRLTGHQVTAFISGNHLDPDLAVEIFILDGEISGRPLPPGRGGV